MSERNLTFMEDGSPIREGDFVVFMYRDSDPCNDERTHLGKVRSEDGVLYAVHIELGYHSKDSDQIDYLFYASDNDEINAGNIMDFEKD